MKTPATNVYEARDLIEAIPDIPTDVLQELLETISAEIDARTNWLHGLRPRTRNAILAAGFTDAERLRAFFSIPGASCDGIGTSMIAEIRAHVGLPPLPTEEIIKP